MSLTSAGPVLKTRTKAPSLPARRASSARTRPVTVRPVSSPRSRLGLGLIGAGAALVPWLFVLGATLPATATAAHWRTAWVGLDTLEALSFIVTGVLVLRRDPRRCLTAMVTATLLTADAWFDVSTAAPGAEQVTAVAMAVLLEIPLAVFSIVLALRALPGKGLSGEG